MRRLALVLALLALSAAQRSCGPEGLQKFYAKIREFAESDDNPFKDEVDEQDQAISRLESRIGIIFAEADKAVNQAEKYAQVLDNLEAQVEGIEGTGCEVGEFNCGDGFTCIDKVLVCDKHNDCKDGYDESEGVCFNPFETDSVWIGTFITDSCTTRQPQNMKLTITDAHPQDYLHSDVSVTAAIYLEASNFGEHVEANFRLHGDYYFGTRQMVFQPPEDDRLGIIIQYDGHHSRDATGWVVRESSLEKCAEIIFHRQ